jgi:hypothetical protein
MCTCQNIFPVVVDRNQAIKMACLLAALLVTNVQALPVELRAALDVVSNVHSNSTNGTFGVQGKPRICVFDIDGTLWQSGCNSPGPAHTIARCKSLNYGIAVNTAEGAGTANWHKVLSALPALHNLHLATIDGFHGPVRCSKLSPTSGFRGRC